MSGREREEAREAVMGVHIMPLENGQQCSRTEVMEIKWKRSTWEWEDPLKKKMNSMNAKNYWASAIRDRHNRLVTIEASPQSRRGQGLEDKST